MCTNFQLEWNEYKMGVWKKAGMSATGHSAVFIRLLGERLADKQEHSPFLKPVSCKPFLAFPQSNARHPSTV